jgi:hypothetical protein
MTTTTISDHRLTTIPVDNDRVVVACTCGWASESLADLGDKFFGTTCAVAYRPHFDEVCPDNELAVERRAYAALAALLVYADRSDVPVAKGDAFVVNNDRSVAVPVDLLARLLSVGGTSPVA